MTITVSFLLLAAVASYVGLIGFPVLGARLAPMTLFALSVGLAPRPAIVFSESALTHVGVSSNSPSLSTYEVGILAILVATLGGYVHGWILLTLGAGIAYLAAMTLLAWPSQQNIVSGALHYSLLLLAFLAGVSSSRKGWFRGRSLAAFSWMLAVCWVFQLCLCLTQKYAEFAALNTSPTPRLFLAEGRALGSFSHPDDLGKLVLLSFAILLPATLSDQRLCRLGAWLGVLAGVMATTLTGARANIVGELTALVLWAVLSNLRKSSAARVRLRYLLPIALIAIPGIEIVRERFRIDAEGGERKHLLAVGQEVLRESFLSGLGPNNYVEVVGQFDPITAQGYPVHNVFILVMAEIGIAGAVLLFLPLLIVAGIAVMRWRYDFERGAWGLGILAMLPAILLICTTGWGMAGGVPSIFWFFVFGVAFGQTAAEGHSGKSRAVPRASGNHVLAGRM